LLLLGVKGAKVKFAVLLCLVLFSVAFGLGAVVSSPSNAQTIVYRRNLPRGDPIDDPKPNFIPMGDPIDDPKPN